MNIPRYRGSIPATNPFENNAGEHTEIPQKSARLKYIDQTNPNSSRNSDLSFSEYAAAIQQGIHVGNYYNTPNNYSENVQNVEPYPASAHPSAREQSDQVKPEIQQPNFNNYPNPANPYGVIYQPLVSKIISTVDPKSSYLNPIINTFLTPPPKSENTEDERDLLEELGIDFNDVFNMFKTVLMFKKMDSNMLNEADMFGPICIFILFGISLMLSGRLTFSLLYAIAVFGSMCMYIILNCMSQDVYIDLYTTMFIIGYSTLPIVPLPILYNALGRIWIALGSASFLISLFWSTAIASMFFETILYMSNKRYMIAYPTMLFFTYFSFVAIL